MTQFDDRERAFEKKFSLDEESEFKTAIRAARLLGAWAADQMGQKIPEAEAYIAQIEEIAIAKPGRSHLLDKIEKDLKAKGIAITRHRLEKEMNDCDNAARKEIAA